MAKLNPPAGSMPVRVKDVERLIGHGLLGPKLTSHICECCVAYDAAVMRRVRDVVDADCAKATGCESTETSVAFIPTTKFVELRLSGDL